MIPRIDQARVRDAEAWMLEAFGTTNAIYMRRITTDPLRVYVSETMRILASAQIPALIKTWRHESGFTSPRGRKQAIDEHAALAVILLQMRIDGDLRFNNMASTILRLTDAERESLGIRVHDIGQAFWYDRLWRAVSRLQRLVDPFPGNRRKMPTREDYKKILAARDPAETAIKQARLSTLCNGLLNGSISLMPRALRRRFKGNTALDATKIPLNGWLGGPSKKNPDGAHCSINYDGGWYVRTGDHDGSGTTYKDKRAWAIEAEITTMTANTPGERATFPLLAHGVSFHKPGKIAGEGNRLVKAILAAGFPILHFMADRAYLPRSTADTLQATLAEIGAKPVFDYDKDEHGQTTFYGDLIQVGGQWYVHYMPQDLIHALDLYRKDRKTAASGVPVDEETPEDDAILSSDSNSVRQAKELRDQRIAEREKYRAKPKGKRRPDGSRQYLYPDPKNYDGLAFDHKTGELIEPIRKKTVVIPAGKDPAKDKALKYGQTYPHKSPVWKNYYALRNTVESQNAFIKDSATEDIDSPMKRRARGNTFASLAVTLALVSANIRKNLTFIQSELARVPLTTKNKSFASTYYSSADITSVTAPTDTAPSPPPS